MGRQGCRLPQTVGDHHHQHHQHRPLHQPSNQIKQTGLVLQGPRWACQSSLWASCLALEAPSACRALWAFSRACRYVPLWGHGMPGHSCRATSRSPMRNVWRATCAESACPLRGRASLAAWSGLQPPRSLLTHGTEAAAATASEQLSAARVSLSPLGVPARRPVLCTIQTGQQGVPGKLDRMRPCQGHHYRDCRRWGAGV